VVATRCGGIPEIVRHLQDGLLVSPGNADEISEAMIKILEDRTMRERFSRNAQRRAQDFSLDGHVANMIDVFEDTIRR
jgi:glycosyltransferase involved in cell wall biosynthesis